MKIKNIHIFGGGTVAHIANHFSIAAPAYGQTSKILGTACEKRFSKSDIDISLHLTKMASSGNSDLETNEDVLKRIEELKKNMNTKIIFFNCALVDFRPDDVYVNEGMKGGYEINSFGKHLTRLETANIEEVQARFVPSEKIIGSIRTGRKDIFLIGFKTTCGATKQEMFEKGLRLCKTSSVNLVLVNDTVTRWNMIVTPEEVTYHETNDRYEVLANLVDMVYYRSQLSFTQSTVVSGDPVSWSDSRVPNSLRTIVNHCIGKNAYKVFNGGTVGHFAVKISDTEFLTSIRKSDFNKLSENGLVYVKTDGPDTVIAYGAKPSVGGQSQRIVFKDHVGMDCIVHFHCPLRDSHPDDIPVRSQREVECGSHQCGQNTSKGLKQFGNLKAVMLDKHGPNIIFNRNIDPQEVIDFIEKNFDLTKKTGGYNI